MKPGQGQAKAAPAAGGQAATTKEIQDSTRTRMERAVADLQHEMSAIRTGRASVSLLEGVRVDYYGSQMPLNQVATLHVPEPTLITVQPFDNSQIGPIEKAIRGADLGLNPSNDGKMIRVPIPPLTTERRRDFAKKLQQMAENHRVSMRNIRRDANDSVKKLTKDKLISEDDEKRALDEIQKTTDGSLQRLETVVKAKEKEILEIK